MQNQTFFNSHPLQYIWRVLSDTYEKTCAFPSWVWRICKPTWANRARFLLDFASFSSKHEHKSLVPSLILRHLQANMSRSCPFPSWFYTISKQKLALLLFGGGYGNLPGGFWRCPILALDRESRIKWIWLWIQDRVLEWLPYELIYVYY